MTREAAELLYLTFAGQTVDERRAALAADAQRCIDSGTSRYRRAGAKRWAAAQLRACAEHLCCPPPAELVKLLELQLGVGGTRRAGQRKNRDRFIAAVEFLAEHPDATDAMIAREIGYRQPNVISAWREDSEFQVLVRNQTWLRAAQKESARE